MGCALFLVKLNTILAELIPSANAQKNLFFMLVKNVNLIKNILFVALHLLIILVLKSLLLFSVLKSRYNCAKLESALSEVKSMDFRKDEVQKHYYSSPVNNIDSSFYLSCIMFSFSCKKLSCAGGRFTLVSASGTGQ